MTLRTGSEQYMVAIEYVHYYINHDILSTAKGFLDEAMDIRRKLGEEAAALSV